MDHARVSQQQSLDAGFRRPAPHSQAQRCVAGATRQAEGSRCSVCQRLHNKELHVWTVGAQEGEVEGGVPVLIQLTQCRGLRGTEEKLDL